MPLSRALLIVALSATIFSTISMAEKFIVGDEEGWTIGFDYKTWTADKVFHVGDKLVFKYPVGKHNVFRVNGTDFKNCTVPASAQGLTTGNDVVVLDTPGRRWYLCGVGDHCLSGQKIFINVLPSESEAPSPSPASGPSSSSHLPAKWLPRKLVALFQR